MKIIAILIFLIILYYVANSVLESIKGAEDPNHNAALLTIIMIIGTVFSIIMSNVLIPKTTPATDSTPTGNEDDYPKEDDAMSDEEYINDGIVSPDETDIESDEINDDSEKHVLNSSNVVSIDPYSDSKLNIAKIENNITSFDSTTIDQINGLIEKEEQQNSYDFTPDIDGVYRFEFSNIPNNVSYSIYLYNSNGEELYHNTGIGNKEGITASLHNGEQYVVTVNQNWNTGSYTLNIGHPKPSQTISELTQLSDSIQYTDQENDYIFVPAIDGVYRFEFSDIPNDISHSIYIYNSDFEELDHYTGIRNSEGITILLLAGQEYHVKVKQNWNLGSYKLNIGKQKPTVYIKGETIISDSIQYTDQENRYVLTTKNSGLYRFEFANIPNNVTNSLYVLNSNLEEIDKSTGIGNEEGISIELNGNETYYLVVKQNWNVGSYNLLIGVPKDQVDISKYSTVNDSIQFKDQMNTYQYISDKTGNISAVFSNCTDDMSMKLMIYNSDWEIIDENTGIGKDSGIDFSVESGITYYIGVQQQWNYGNYTLNIF